jgi:hypothetical protein
MTDEARVSIQIRNMNALAADKLLYDLRNVLDRHGMAYGVYISKARR